MKKKLLTILLSVSLVLAFASTGVFAASDPPYSDLGNGFYNTPFVVSSSRPSNDVILDQGVRFEYGQYPRYFITYGNDTTYPVYLAYTYNGSSRTTVNVYVLVGSQVYNSGFVNSYNDSYSPITRTRAVFDDASYPRNSIYYFRWWNNYALSDIPATPSYIFEDSDSMFAAFDDFIDSGYSTSVGEWVNFSIKPGYAFVIEGECEILERSYYINNSWSFFGTNNAHRTNGSSERVSAIGNIRDGFSVDYGLERDQLIQWAAQNPNLVGDASIYEFYDNDLVSLSSGSAFFVSYPLYDGVQTTLQGLRSRENSVDLIGSVYLNYSTRPSFRYVALKSNIDANNKDVAFYNTLQPSITDSSGNVTEGPDGTTISPGDIPSGGGDSSTPPLDEDNSLLGTISKFVNDIKRLLSTAVESINTLVAEGSQFMRTVAQMFTWLPEQLTSLLVAAFTVLVVVGVLKVLWR